MPLVPNLHAGSSTYCREHAHICVELVAIGSPSDVKDNSVLSVVSIFLFSTSGHHCYPDHIGQFIQQYFRH